MRRFPVPFIVLLAALVGTAACDKAANVLPPAAEKDTFNVHPSDQPQVLTNSTGKAAVKLAGNTVGENTKLILTVIDGGAAPLLTKLDKYPSYVLISSSSPLSKPAVVAVCPSGDIAPDVRARLRLGHQPAAGFEITPAADGSFLDCSAIASASRLPSWVKSLANLILPKPLYARFRATGGVGGSASEFSPFGPVDPELRAAGGVGGTASEFQQSPGSSSNKVPGAGSTTVVNGACTAIEAPAGGSLEKECRPGMIIKTAKGTVLTGVPISWAVTAGGGTVASETPVTRACGTFGANTSNATNENGKAGACWTLGGTIGTNTVVAIPSAGGDAPPGVSFSPSSQAFTATALKITPVATVLGGEFTFDGLAHAGSGSCSNGLTPAINYTPGGVLPPKDVGIYLITVTCGAGLATFNTVSASAGIVISAIPATINISCPAAVAYTGSPITPCTATVTAPGLTQSATPEYTANVNAGTATATVNFAGTGSIGAASATKAFQITTSPSAVTMSCAISVVYNTAVQSPCEAAVSGVGGFRQPVTVSYSPSLPKLPGSYSATATFVASGNFQASTSTKTFTVAKAPATATAGSGGMLPGGTVPTLPCVVTGLFASEAGTVTCTTSVPTPLALGQNATTAVVTPANPANYAVTTLQGTVTVGYVQRDCYGPPLLPPIPPISSGITKGTTIVISCTLLNPAGGPALNAIGTFVLYDKGVDGFGVPGVLLDVADAFAIGSTGIYSYTLSTSGLTPGRYYGAYAYWNDGSQSSGWFYLKP